MDYREVVQVALDSIVTHKLRSALTTLGVVFGVAAVIAMLSIGEGAKQEALEQIALLGTNNILIKATTPPKSSGSEEVEGRSEGLSLADARNIEALSHLVTAVVPERWEQIDRANFGDKESKVEVIATTPDYLALANQRLRRGSFFSAEDNTEGRRVCVIGSEVKRNLFAFDDPVGKPIKLGDDYYTVLGVTEEKSIGKPKVEGLEVKNVNQQVYLPLGTAQNRLERGGGGEGFYAFGGVTIFSSEGGGTKASEVDVLTVKVSDKEQIQPVAHVIKKLLERRHRGVADFEIVIPEALLYQSQKTQRIFNIVMGAIAGISLLVGGIGIMNIMLASVYERTREIGVRRAVGARRNDVLRQFLVEAVAISFVGCLLGLILGFGLARSVSYYAKWRTIISLFSIVLAVGVSALVGIAFGYYPARRAAGLDPIEALRYE